jgi:hypothetical protein
MIQLFSDIFKSAYVTRLPDKLLAQNLNRSGVLAI